MIRNERQFHVTQAQRERLASHLTAEVDTATPDWAIRASRQAIEAQLLDLDEELAEYDALRSANGAQPSTVSNLVELPDALVRARIAAHLSQRELADRLGLREQQIQRYESTDYAGASIARLQEVMHALEVSLAGEVELPPTADSSGAKIRRALTGAGIAGPVITRRFFGGAGTAEWANAAARVARIFHVDLDDVLDGILPDAASAASFHASAAASRERVNGFARYAEYLADRLRVVCVTPYRPLPEAGVLRELLGKRLREQPLETLVRTCWEHGIPVLPVSDPGAFYGACYYFSTGPVIALKNANRSPDRWAFLLAHEMSHTRDEGSSSVLEQDIDAREWRELPNERTADNYATELLLGPEAEAMVRVTVDRAQNSVARLKAVVPDVASAMGISVGLLADHVAFRVEQSGINWWPAANRLHGSRADAWRICRSILFEYIDLSRIDNLDRDILVDGIAQ